jgi:hypothetical protein
VRQEWKLSRETETPAFTGRIDGIEDISEKSSEPTAEEKRVLHVKEMLKAESLAFFNMFIQTSQGKRDFANWMWKKVLPLFPSLFFHSHPSFSSSFCSSSILAKYFLKSHSEAHNGVSAPELRSIIELLRKDGIFPSQLLFGSMQSTEEEGSNLEVREEKRYEGEEEVDGRREIGEGC